MRRADFTTPLDAAIYFGKLKCAARGRMLWVSRCQLEIIRRNSGGYFQSEDTLKLKLGITITSLEHGRWSKVPGRVEECLHQLNAQFQMRFESED